MPRTIERAGRFNLRCRGGLGIAALFLALSPGPVHAQKSDSVIVRNGDQMVGEMKGLQRGQLEFKTDALQTVYVEWPKVTSVNTIKIFEILLEDGTMYFGTLRRAPGDSVLIRADSLALTVPTQSVVELQRIKSSFWDALDGNFNLGLDFTQQNAKTDLSISGEVKYAVRQKGRSDQGFRFAEGLNITKLTFNTSFSRQDSTEDIERLQVSLSHTKQLQNKWFWVVTLGAERNSQLSLDYRMGVAGGAGRSLVQSNRLDLGLWLGPSYALEQFTGEEPDSSVPLVFAADADYFTWGSLDTTMSSQLQVIPILDQWGRWRINFSLNADREVVKNFYVNVGVTEAYDSQPAADANKNDFSFTTSFGWKF